MSIEPASRAAVAACRSCRHFDDSPTAIEAALPGLKALSSAYAAVRADDGLCSVHQRCVAAARVCDSYVVSPAYGA